ncbi:hypothetical protein [Paraburkholderia sp. XV]|uniref:hypothetical protein n=1 Tax=Paraburkholderia sp. XV TaxID=2831520 RepID=UPI001CD404FD|nr:hypothetical protein [Paraburkholderia sp. XV]
MQLSALAEEEIEPEIEEILSRADGSADSFNQSGSLPEKLAGKLGCRISTSRSENSTSLHITCDESLVMSRTRSLRFVGAIPKDWPLELVATKRYTVMGKVAVLLGAFAVQDSFKDPTIQSIHVDCTFDVFNAASQKINAPIFALNVSRSDYAAKSDATDDLHRALRFFDADKFSSQYKKGRADEWD